MGKTDGEVGDQKAKARRLENATCVYTLEGWRSLAGKDRGSRWTTAGERTGDLQPDKGFSLNLKNLPIFQKRLWSH